MGYRVVISNKIVMHGVITPSDQIIINESTCLKRLKVGTKYPIIENIFRWFENSTHANYCGICP